MSVKKTNSISLIIMVAKRKIVLCDMVNAVAVNATSRFLHIMCSRKNNRNIDKNSKAPLIILMA